MLGTEKFYGAMVGKAEFQHRLVADAEFQMMHNARPAGSYRADAVDTHCLAVQHAGTVRYDARFGDRRRQQWASPGMSWFKPAGTDNAMSWERPTEVLDLWIAPILWDRVLADVRVPAPRELRSRSIEADPLIQQIASALKQGVEQRQPLGRLVQDSLVVALIAHLAQRGTSRSDPPASRGGLADWRLRRVLEHIEEHLAEDITLTELAQVAGLSEHHFGTVFKATLGQPPHRFLIEKRIARAKQLFARDRAISVTEVAMTVGFTTSTHFATMFRKLTGATPSAFRASL